MEVLLGLPIFLITVLFLIDIARYFYIYLTLNYAAHATADYASKLEIEVDTSLSECTANPIQCTRYKNRVGIIINQGERLANLATNPSSAVNAAVRLRRFSHYDNVNFYDSGHNLSGLGALIDGDIAFLRPGEIVRRPDGTTYQHPTRAYGLGSDEGWPHGGMGWGLLLDREPIAIHIEAWYQPIVYLFPRLVISSTAFAYRRAKQYGAGAPPSTSSTSSLTTSVSTSTSTTSIPTTSISTSVSTSIPTTSIATTVSTSIPTTVSTSIATTSTWFIWTPTPSPTAGTSISTTVSTSIPTTVTTSIATTVSTSIPTTVTTSIPTTSISTTVSTTIPTTSISTTVSTTIPTTSVSTTIVTTSTLCPCEWCDNDLIDGPCCLKCEGG